MLLEIQTYKGVLLLRALLLSFFFPLSLRVRKMINLKNESASRVGSRGSVDESDESKMNRARVCVCVLDW